MSYHLRDRKDASFPRLSGYSRPTDRNLTILEDEIEKLVSYGKVKGSPQSRRKLEQDLHDQVKMYQKELDKKDKLIQDLSKSDIPDRRQISFDARDVREFGRGDLTLLQLKNEQLQNELKDAKSKIFTYELKLREMQADSDHYKEDSLRQSAMIQTMKLRIEDLQYTSGFRGEQALSTLQEDSKEQQNRILELESRIRDLVSEKEEAEQRTQSWQRKFGEITLQLQKTMSVEEDMPENLVEKIKDIFQENLTLRGKLSTLKESLESSETEAKASRDTIQRLVSEIDREQKTYLSNATSAEKMKIERNAALREKEQREEEIKLLRDRLEANEDAWISKRRELDQHHSKVSSLNHDVKNSKLDAHVAKSELKSFKDSLAVILGDVDMTFGPHMDEIMEKVKDLAMKKREMDAHAEGLESQVKALNEQLENQAKLHHLALERAKRAEIEYEDNKTRVRLLEDGISSSDALRDVMKKEKQKYMAYLSKLADALGMDSICHDLGFDMNGEALLSRAEQLMKREGNIVVDKTTHVYTLQRKLKTLKQQLESKDLHLDLMRKKIVALEEGVAGRSNIQKEKEDYEWSYKKLIKENDRLRGELGDAKKIVTEMKANMHDVNNVKFTNYAQQSEIEDLTQKLEKLEKVKEKQSRKLVGMKQELEYTNQEATQHFQDAESSLVNLTEELRITKELLREIQHRERQLTDFRQVIAKMLGLDVTVLAIPDYEIISRLEKLIQAHHSHSITTLGLEQSLNTMEHGFKQGYQEASSLMNGVRKTKMRTLSPTRKRTVHPQVY